MTIALLQAQIEALELQIAEAQREAADWKAQHARVLSCWKTDVDDLTKFALCNESAAFCTSPRRVDFVNEDGSNPQEHILVQVIRKPGAPPVLVDMNLNNTVYFTTTEAGARVAEQKGYHWPAGVTHSDQFWEFMYVFGEHSYMGAPMMYSTNVHVDTQD